MTFSYNTKFIFDLDDTLYSERDFEKSGIEFLYNYLKIKKITLESLLNNRNNWIQEILKNSDIHITLDLILDLYRNHFPIINLYKDSKYFLEYLYSLGIEMSLITDGRSVTQRNKLKALGIESYFKHIIISEEINSEKPSALNFKIVMNNCNNKYVYIADNPLKDFITPNNLGWTSICLLDRGHNIHKQIFNLSNEFLPQFTINSFQEIILLNEN